tara:strand:+ start:459 stop:1055 length:597 start_codon:yes stop_codon:yes gene_type:complete
MDRNAWKPDAETKMDMKKIEFHYALERMSQKYIDERLAKWRKKGHKNPIFYFYDRNAHVRMLYSPIFENRATGTCEEDTKKRFKEMAGKRNQVMASWTLHSKYENRQKGAYHMFIIYEDDDGDLRFENYSNGEHMDLDLFLWFTPELCSSLQKIKVYSKPELSGWSKRQIKKIYKRLLNHIESNNYIPWEFLCHHAGC